MSCQCQGCGRNYKTDLLIPDNLWEKIKPKGSLIGADLLCGACIMERIEYLSGYSVWRLEKIEGI